MVRIESKNTYDILSYHQPFSALQVTNTSKDGADIVGYTKQKLDRGYWVAKSEENSCYSLTNRSSSGTRFVLVERGNVVTVEPFDIRGAYSQQWIVQTLPKETAWGTIMNRQTGNYLQFNGENKKLTCVPMKPGSTYQYWCFGLIARGRDGDWLDSLEPKAATTPANTNSTQETPVVQYTNPTPKTLVTGGDAHENSYAEVLQLKLQLYEAQLRLQQEQLAAKNRQLAAYGNAYGTAGYFGNTNGFGNVYGNGTGGIVGNLNGNVNNTVFGFGNEISGLSDVDSRNAALHGKLNILQIEIRHKQDQIFDSARAPGDHSHVDTEILSKEKNLAEQAHSHVLNQLKAQQLPVN